MKPPIISVIIPVFNESDNVSPLFNSLQKIFSHRHWEVIFVDDNSPDGTISTIRALAQETPHVRGIRRVGRKGLSSAVIEGVMSSSAPFIAVMDGDLQHDESRLRPMLQALESGSCDLVVASRYISGGRDSGLAHYGRRLLSRGGRWMTRLFLRTTLSDPMSGFFAMRRDVFDQRVEKLSGKGFKILLDLILADPAPLRIAEIPMVFRHREHGESKLGWTVMLSFATMVFHHIVRRRISRKR